MAELLLTVSSDSSLRRSGVRLLNVSWWMERVAPVLSARLLLGPTRLIPEQVEPVRPGSFSAGSPAEPDLTFTEMVLCHSAQFLSGWSARASANANPPPESLLRQYVPVETVVLTSGGQTLTSFSHERQQSNVSTIRLL